MVVALVAAVGVGSCSARVTDEPKSAPRPAANAVSDRVAGEYIVTVHAGTEMALLREIYGAFGVRELRDLGNDLFLIKLNQDPGLEEIKRKGIESGKVKDAQPNFRYRAS